MLHCESEEGMMEEKSVQRVTNRKGVNSELNKKKIPMFSFISVKVNNYYSPFNLLYADRSVTFFWLGPYLPGMPNFYCQQSIDTSYEVPDASKVH